MFEQELYFFSLQINLLMKSMANTLNLQPHLVSDRKGNSVVMHGPGNNNLCEYADCCKVDLEVHMGLDGRIYVVDAARLFPCFPPQKQVR